mmetsp:Transcript_6220/g.13740  ORF Transcript_6220/g.13740 Transcript_6220/m.13740 type:complete len:99 (+) Transcript_6220:170-466(+)
MGMHRESMTGMGAGAVVEGCVGAVGEGAEAVGGVGSVGVVVGEGEGEAVAVGPVGVVGTGVGEAGAGATSALGISATPMEGKKLGMAMEGTGCTVGEK